MKCAHMSVSIVGNGFINYIFQIKKAKNILSVRIDPS